MKSMKPTGRISASSPLIFPHMPKTGGMSLFAAFAELWGTSIADLYNISARAPQVAIAAVNDQSRAVFCGHFSYGLHEWLNRPSYYVTVLREPVARMVSLYHFIRPRWEGGRALLKQYREAGLSSPPVGAIPEFNLDFMPWMQAGRESAATFFECPSAELDNGMVRRISGYGLNPVPCPGSELDRAKDNIERSFSVVGLLERYPETLDLMARTFDLPALKENRVNSTRQKENQAPLGESLLRKIREQNELDSALYDWVADRFDTKLASPRLISKLGLGRKDYRSLPLWKGVGVSPIREAAMQQRGVPKNAEQILRSSGGRS